MRFRHRPFEIDAWRLEASHFDDPHPNPHHIRGVIYDPALRCVFIRTLEGEMRAEIGDWIILGTAGELYPCKPDIFEEIYVAV